MAFNLFEGARRIALLFGGIAVAGTLIVLYQYEPYVSIQYVVYHPSGLKYRSEATCPTDADHHYFSTNSKDGKSISITLCITAMSFGKDSTRLIPYKVDENGMIWGAASYSDDVTEYERRLETRFNLPEGDEKEIRKEIRKRYWKNWKESVGYLTIGLVVYAGIVWAIGWIVRGFLGIPQGMDRKPDPKT